MGQNDIEFRIGADISGLRAELTRMRDELGRVGQTGQQAGRTAAGGMQGFQASLGPVKTELLALATQLGGLSLAAAALSKSISVQREFDKLNAGLITATGSSENAAEAFKQLQQFAATTPYTLSQSVEGFTKLVNLGLTPSRRALKAYGDTAAATGKDLMQMIEAVADAATGEFERLKEFGIKASQQGDKVSLTFQGVKTTVANNAAAIEEYLIKLGENKFADAMANRMDTLDGAISNLGDSWDALWLTISQKAIGPLMAQGVNVASGALQGLKDRLDSGEWDSLLGGIAKGFRLFGEDAGADIKSIGDVLGDASEQLTQFRKDSLRELNTLANAWGGFKFQIQAAATYVAAAVDAAQNPGKDALSIARQQIEALKQQQIDAHDAILKGEAEYDFRKTKREMQKADPTGSIASLQKMMDAQQGLERYKKGGSTTDPQDDKKARERAIALSEYKLALEKTRLQGENEAAQAQFDQQKISIGELYQIRIENLQTLHRLELAAMDAKIKRSNSDDRQELIRKRNLMAANFAREGAALEAEAQARMFEYAQRVGKENEAVNKALSELNQKLMTDTQGELDRRLADVENSYQSTAEKIDELRKKVILADQRKQPIHIVDESGQMFEVTPELVAAHEAELQAQIEQAKQQVRERYAEEQRLAQAKLAGQLAQLEGRELEAALAEIDAKWRDVLEQMRRDGDSAGIEIVAKIIVKEKAIAQAEDTQRAIQRVMDRYQSGAGSLDQAAEGDWRTQLTLGSAKQQLAQNAMTELQPLRDQLAQSRDQGVTGLDADIARINATIEELAQVCPTAQARLGVFLSDLAQAGVESAESGLSNFFMDLVEGTKSGSQALKDFARSFVMSMAQVAAKALATFAVLKLLDAIYPGLGQATAAMAGAGVHHDGGIAGQASATRSVNPLLFAAAPRYHVGGIAGLRPGEVPAILQAGEEVLTRNDPRHVANGGGSRSVRIINEFSPDATLNHMQSSAGEEVILNVIGRNAGSIRRLLG